MSNDDFGNDGISGEINSPDFGDEGQKSKSEIKAISNAGQALQIAQRLAFNDIERDIRRSRVLSAFNGAAPYCDADLVNKAQGYRYNVSFGFMEGVIGRAVVPYNDLTINIADLTEIKANLNDEKLKVVQTEFGKIMDKWGRWPKFISRLNQDLVLNGYNAAIFPSDYDPFPIFVAQKDGWVDEGTPNDVRDVECFVWRKSYMLHELYSKIADESIAEKAGWNVENVRQALMNAASKDLLNSGSTLQGTWTTFESLIRGGALWGSIIGAKMVNVFHVFATEIDGKVTHYIVLDNGTVDVQNDYTDLNDGPELFKKEKRFNDMQDFLVYFDLEVGDGTWHGSRGVGQRAFNTHKANDKMINSALDTTFTAGLVMMQPGDQTQQEDMQLAVMGPFAIIPQGIQISPEVLPNVAPTFFQMQALLANTSEQRIGDVVPQIQQPTGASITATQAKISAGRQELVTKGNLKRYVDPVSQLISIIVRRLLKKNSPNAYAKEFQAELKRKGLTDDDLKEIRGARNTGKIEDILGNTAAATQVLFAEFRGDPEIDQFKLKTRRIASVLDADAAEELIIDDEDKTKEIEAARQQIEEITSIKSGSNIPVSPRDNHQVHLEVLLGDIGTAVQGQAQNFNPEAIPILKALVSHGAEHIKYLSADKSKKQVAKPLEERLKLAVDAIKTLEKQARQMAEAAFKQAGKLAKTPEEQAQVQQAMAQLQTTQPPQ